MKMFSLKNGMQLPAIGFGTSQLKGEVGAAAVSDALAVGYRHIDTADMYGNHREVGEAIRRSGINRSEMFVTTKLLPSSLSATDVHSSTARFLEELQLSYIDLLLIHWPNKAVALSETLPAMEELRKKGTIRAIGVSNFTAHHLEDAKASGVEIVANQVEVHPTFNQSALRDYCAQEHITVIAYAPLGRGSNLKDPLLLELAQKYDVSTAQVALNWLISRGVATIPRSANRKHMEDNLQAATWQMQEPDLARIDALGQESRIFEPSFSEFDY